MRKRVLTGDRVTGSLHLGHYLGSIKNRVRLQENHDCAFLLADLHSLTTKRHKEDIQQLPKIIEDIVLTYLSCGIDPQKSLIYRQSAIKETYELLFYFSLLTTVNRLQRIPSLKEMLSSSKDAEMNLGLLGYPVLQAADILLFKADLVPVGKDNEYHLELTREIIRRFNSYYPPVWKLPKTLLGQEDTLIGTDGKGKMSKSLGNAIWLNENSPDLKRKVFSMFTDPTRKKATDKGTVEGNPVFIYHDHFNSNTQEVAELKERYQQGKVGDVEVKQKLFVVLDAFLEPFREKRAYYVNQKNLVQDILSTGSQAMQVVAQETLENTRAAMGF